MAMYTDDDPYYKDVPLEMDLPAPRVSTVVHVPPTVPAPSLDYAGPVDGFARKATRSRDLVLAQTPTTATAQFMKLIQSPEQEAETKRRLDGLDVPHDAKRRANPFSSCVSLPMFDLKSSVLMANINFAYRLVPTVEQAPTPLFFCDLSPRNLRFDEFIYYWRPRNTVGRVLTSDPNEKDSRDGRAKVTRVQPKAGHGECARKLLESVPEGGVSLVAINGFNEEIAEGNGPSALLANCLVAVKVLRERGAMLVRVSRTQSPFFASLIVILSALFNDISFFKPVMLDPYSDERFLMCKDLFSAAYRKPVVELMEKAIPLAVSYDVPLLTEESMSVAVGPLEALRRANIRFAKAQVVAVDEIQKCAQDLNRMLVDPVAVKKEATARWKLSKKRGRGGDLATNKAKRRASAVRDILG